MFLTRNNFLSYPRDKLFSRYSSTCSTNVPYYCGFLAQRWGLPPPTQLVLKNLTLNEIWNSSTSNAEKENYDSHLMNLLVSGFTPQPPMSPIYYMCTMTAQRLLIFFWNQLDENVGDLVFLHSSSLAAVDPEKLGLRRPHGRCGCNTLQHTAAHCNVLSHTGLHCDMYSNLASDAPMEDEAATRCTTP